MSKNSLYRPDIDGLRALAVVAIILFHFKVSGFTGGFIGVDVFFVISGYLITRIIVKEVAEGTFSLTDFWGRRIRRIVPALVVVTAVTAVASYFVLLLPVDFSAFGRTLMAQSFFVSNWWFMGLSDYFAAPVETIPMLHTWSLAIEEQFYIFLPLCVLFISRFTRKKTMLGFVLFDIALLSFVYGVYLVISNPTDQFTIQMLPHVWGSATNASAGFYFIAPRVWELLVGGLVAIFALQIKHRAGAEVVSLGGLAAIFAGIFLIGETTAFPGVAALLPVLGTTAIIVANTSHETMVKTLLSFPVVVGVGLISYSLYLWHWPLLVLARYHADGFGESLTSVHQFFLLLLIVVLSFLTYRYVETPFRQKRFFAGQKKLYVAGAIALLGVFCIGLLIVNKQGFPQRVSPGALYVADAMNDSNPRQDECFTKSALTPTATEEPCLLGTQNPEHVDFVLWGDSHANAVMPAFDAYGLTTNKTGVFFGTSGCAPLVQDASITDDVVCLGEIQQAISYIQQNEPKEVFMVAEWKEGYTFGDSMKGFFLSAMLSNTIEQLPTATHFSVLLRIPTYPEASFRDHFFRAQHKSIYINTKFPRADFAPLSEYIDIQIEEIAAEYPNVDILRPLDTLCDAEYCYRGSDQGLYYSDSSHLSTHGARQIILPLLLNATN